MPGQMIAEATAEWGEQVWHLKVDLAHAFGARRYVDSSRILRDRLSAVGALVMVNIIYGHSLVPLCLLFASGGVPVRKQGAPVDVDHLAR